MAGTYHLYGIDAQRARNDMSEGDSEERVSERWGIPLDIVKRLKAGEFDKNGGWFVKKFQDGKEIGSFRALDRLS